MKLCLLFYLGLTTLLCFGCRNQDTPAKVGKPALSNPETEEQNQLFTARLYYNENRLDEALDLSNQLLNEKANDSNALFLKVLILLKKHQYQEAIRIIQKIDTIGRSNMPNSCVELTELYKQKSNDVLAFAVEYFPECADEFNEEEIIEESGSGIPYFEIIRLGKLYEQQILQENDAQVRRVKEEMFLQDHNLTREQVTEISTRYLEFTARD